MRGNRIARLLRRVSSLLSKALDRELNHHTNGT